MDLIISRAVAEAIPAKSLHRFLPKPEEWKYRKHSDIDLTALRLSELDALERTFKAHAGVHGVAVLLRDIATWRGAQTKAGQAKARTVRQFASLLKQYLAGVSGHRVYQRGEADVWLSGYVNEVEYEPPNVQYHSPAHVTMTVVWTQFGGQRHRGESFYESDVRNVSVAEVLARKGYAPETPALRAKYEAELKRFHAVAEKVGLQCWMEGVGYDDPDGNPEGHDNSWWWSRVNAIQMVRDGHPTRVVVDVFYENDETERDAKKEGRVHVDRFFWRRVRSAPLVEEDDDDAAEDTSEEAVQDAVDAGDAAEPEIPIRPYLVVFDMTKHLRLRAHVSYLTDYKYDTELAEKLILPPALKALVSMLVAHREGQFHDIVRGKGGGAVVLLAGPPGVGKTLTAEVYAESSERPLYSVQCSQLGTRPDALEEALLKVFARAKRWHAVCLLDEADVYVHERGRDLDQNAIVGVFLRVLEYQDSVMFLTTNRPDDVDDAILSRCVARLPYPKPSPADQRRIWRVLADTAQVDLPEPVLARVVRAHHDLTGRDIKNVLKLAHLLRRGAALTVEAVAFARQFQPTGVAPKMLRDPSAALLQDLAKRPKPARGSMRARLARSRGRARE